MTRKEQDVRLQMLDTILATSRCRLDEIHLMHGKIASADPWFYVRLAAWYARHGDVREHNEMFVVTLSLSNVKGHRDIGLVLLRKLSPEQVGRVLDFVHGRKTTRKVPIRVTPLATQLFPVQDSLVGRMNGKLRRQSKDSPAPVLKAAPLYQLETEYFGLFRSPPRSLRTAIVRYLRDREADVELFDESVRTARKSLKRMYALLHVQPSERAQRMLFDGERLGGNGQLPPTPGKISSVAASYPDRPALLAEIMRHPLPSHRELSEVET